MVYSAFRAGALAACAAGALSASLLSSAADAQPARNVAQAERDRASAQAQAERLRVQVNRNSSEIAALDQRLIEAGRRRVEAEAAATDAEARLAALRQQAAADAAQYHGDRNSLEAAMVSAAFAQRQLEPSLIHIGMMAAAAAPLFATHMHATSEALAAAQRRDAEITEEQRNLTAAQAAIDAERADVIVLLARRRALQSELVRDADAAEARARRYAAEARSLRELAQRVQPRTTNRSAAPATIPASWVAPAAGGILRRFGARTSGGPPSQGVLLRTRADAQVVAPAAGQVDYAGPFRGYGQVIILNRTDGYTVVLAGLASARTRVGEHVLAGQPLGEMSGSATGGPELYVEIRRNGQPIDPGRWLDGRGLTTASRSDDAG